MENNKETTNQGLKYTGLGFQMLGTIAFCTYAGYLIDNYFKNAFPVGIVVGSLLGVGGGLYAVIKEFMYKGK